MTASLTDDILAAHEDVDRLVAWAEPNCLALEDEAVGEAVRQALRRPVPDYLRGQNPDDPRATAPLLRFGGGRAAAVPLLDGLNQRRANPSQCDRCGVRAQRRTHRLLVPAGQSVVALYCCSQCRGTLQDVFACGLVWD